MKKLSKEKRSQLILVALLTAGAIVGLWFGLIDMQKQKISEIDKKIKDSNLRRRIVSLVQEITGGQDR